MEKFTPAELQIELDEAPSHDDLDVLRQGLTEHARGFVEQPGFQPLAVFARHQSGRIVGGALGWLNWNWLDASLLWVDEGLRDAGLGSRLLRRLEDEAYQRGCRRAHLETFSYQARRFYERHGYRSFATLPDYPPGHTKVYLRKDLDPRI